MSKDGGGGRGGPAGNGPARRGLPVLRLLGEDRTSVWAIPAFSIALSLATAAALLLAMGKNPLAALAAFLRGSGFLPRPSYAGGQNMATDFLAFLGIMAPMLLASLGMVVALRAGLFNIGIAGQMLASGFLALVTVGYSGLPGIIARPLVILIGIGAGGLLGALAGWLKSRFNIHEVVSTIMFNYIINYITGFYINSYFVDPITRASRICSASSRLTLTGLALGRLRPTLPLGILIALAAALVIRFVLDRTTLGLELKAVGLNRDAARYAGVKEGRCIVLAMLFSGALAGLAGVCYYLGYYNNIVPKSLPDMGFDAIAVALLGNTSPAGSVFASVLVTVFQRGSVYMSSTVGVPKEIASVIIGFLLLFSACNGYIRYFAKSRLEKSTWT
ncbi:MAG: ABC transporter permease [Treponema sp.]|jgi:simple sugar transport system permease protein|nr:ABC transporter permease [Treponema sp.]